MRKCSIRFIVLSYLRGADTTASASLYDRRPAQESTDQHGVILDPSAADGQNISARAATPRKHGTTTTDSGAGSG
ncbi:hypothetical protein BJ912DRAFT_234965 [Pholiota molesta]|nr:hypothetical protein BJ912DRAFT_234965 [Pholiota molesta]